MKPRLFVVVAAAVLWMSGDGGSGLRAQAPDIRASYTKTEHMVAMRDGVKLFTIVYAPKDTTSTYPFMLHRTPYGSPPYGPDAYRTSLGPSAAFGAEKFLFVYQDVRGKFRSEGDFVVMRPLVPSPKGPRATDESTDTFDTIDWLVKNVPNNNGRVGQWGISYPGSQTVWGMIDAHPALKASSPQAPAIDMFLGDDFHHNGAFRLMYTFSWLAGNARPRAGATETRRGFDYGTPDGYRFFLDAGPVANINEKYFNYSVPTWNEYMDHPDYDDYWQRQNPLKHVRNITHAVLNVAGWFDAEDFYGPLETYRAVERTAPVNKNQIVIGPWLHGGWASMPGDALGEIRFGSPTGEYYRKEIELPFFTYHLKDKGAPPTAEATVFETGGNTWKTFETWPPAATEARTLYFQADGGLSFTRPPASTAGSGYDEYVSDPAKPVPWSTETRTTQGHLWMVEDQRFAAARPDVLVYRTEPLTEDVVVAGPVIASIVASSSGTDADWIVKLIDVYPGNAPDNQPNPRGVRMGDFQMLLAGEVFRARYRRSFSTPVALVPNQPEKYEFDLRDRFHRFLKGHRIMVQVQSTWFPVIDRNPQTFVDIYKAKPADFRKATQRVYRTADRPSGIRVGVVK